MAPKSGEDRFFFRRAAPIANTSHVGVAVSEEEGGVRDSTCTTKEEEKDPSRRRRMLPEKNNNRTCNSTVNVGICLFH